jgi:nitroreductase
MNMKTLTGKQTMTFNDLARKRYSCRKLAAKPVEQEKIDAIVEAGILAPTAVNKQPFRIWVAKSPEAVKAIHETTAFTFGAEVFLVVGAKRDEAWVRPADNANFADVDATIVATHMMLAIEDQGLATTWVGHFDAPKLQELLPELAGFDLVAIFPVGYADPSAAPSALHTRRKSATELVKCL